MREVDVSRRNAELAHDRFTDHFDRREIRTQQIEICRVEQLQ